MRNLSFSLVGIGLLLVVFFALADTLGLGGDRGIGATQLLGIQAGALFVLLGIGLLTVKWEGETIFRKRFEIAQIFNVPYLYWILFTFLIVYVSFFLLPVFFSKLQMQYLTKYIPDAFVTHIGFDIESIVSRIENWLRTGVSPYADEFIAYPPLAVAVFATFSLIGYPAYFKLMVSITVLAYLITALVIPFSLVPKRNRVLLILFFITGLFSYGLQFEQERGQFNLIAFTLCLSAIYIFHFHYKFRYFAYLLFTVAVQLKVYPVFFVVMFIDDWRDWRAILKRFLGLGLLNFSSLFILGYKLFLDFVKTITGYQLLESSRYENLSIKGFVTYLSSTHPGLTEIPFWILLGICFLSVVGYAFYCNRRGLNPYLLLICTLAALIIPSVSNDYKLSLLIAPIALFFCCLPEVNNASKKTLLTTLVIFASLAYWTTLFPATVKPEFLSRNFPALVVIMISVTMLNFLAPYSYEGTVQENHHNAELET